MSFTMKPGNGKVYVGMPRERMLIPQFVDSRDVVLSHINAKGLYAGYYNVDGHRVDNNRDSICLQWRDRTEAEWLQFMDTDMEFPDTLILRLLSCNKPIVGALYFHRGHNHDPFVFREGGMRKDKWGREQQTWIPERKLVYKFLNDNGIPMRDGAFVIDNPIGEHLIDCDAIATGAMLIHRSVIEALDPPWFEYKDGGGSEDLAFCYRAKHELGIPIFADISTVCGHYHMVPMGQAQFRMKYESLPITLSSFSLREASELLGIFLGIPPEKALKKIDDGSGATVQDHWRKLFQDRKPEELTDKQISKFYKDPRTGRNYIIELMHWNIHPNFTALRSELLRYREIDVIELGSGIGTVAMQLLFQDCNVLAIETSAVLRDFMLLRMNHFQEIAKEEFSHACSIQTEEWMTKSPNESFDLAVALDVFEHMPLAILKRNLVNLSRVLKPNGILFYHANFKQQNIYPMHFDYSKDWDIILKEAGFDPISSTEAIKK